MKRKGFTLIETLAVIVVLAIIGLIATPLVTRTINQGKEGLYDRQIESIVEAGKIGEVRTPLNYQKKKMKKSIYQ